MMDGDISITGLENWKKVARQPDIVHKIEDIRIFARKPHSIR